MSQFIDIKDYDASLHREILDALVRDDETLVEICEDRAIAEMRGYLSKRYDCNAIFSTTGKKRNQLILMMVIDIAVYHIFCIHNPQKLSQVRKDRYERAVEWMKAVASEKGADDPMYQMAMTLLERNKAGDLDYKSISKLYELEDKFDSEYGEIMALFKEANVVQKNAVNYYFQKRNPETNVWSRIEPSFCRM